MVIMVIFNKGNCMPFCFPVLSICYNAVIKVDSFYNKNSIYKITHDGTFSHLFLWKEKKKKNLRKAETL